MNKIVPILKWAGGKRQLLPVIMPRIPKDYVRYYEPFVGAGAVLFELQPANAVINDANGELINVYNIIKQRPNDLIVLLKQYEKNHSKDEYYRLRNLDRDVTEFSGLSSLEKAARTIYLNRTCYNGLYRVNRKGFFNTPIGRNSSIQIVNEKGILDINGFLNSSNIQIMNGDYRTSIKTATSNDFVFLDPPYYPTNRDSFLRYDVSPFGIDEQEDLKRVGDGLTHRGIRFIETNSDCQEIRELYSGYNLVEVDVRRCINANADGRRGKELIISNF